jgi:ribosomal protein S18 acetylase RimI-like enzyme
MDNAAALPDPVNRMCGHDGRMIVADINGEIVGCAGYRPTRQVSYVTAMYIRPDRQRQGLGSDMLAKILRRLPVDRNVVVYAKASSTWAVAFYEKQGFKRFEQVELDLGNGTSSPCIGLFLHQSNLVRIDGGL